MIVANNRFQKIGLPLGSRPTVEACYAANSLALFKPSIGLTIMNLAKQLSSTFLALLALQIFLLSCSETKTYSTIENISVGKERVISIYAENSWEVNRGLYYDVTESGSLIVPKTFWGTDDGKSKHSFASVRSADSNIVGIIEKKGIKNSLVIIQDFPSKESWPRLNDNEVSYDKRVIKKWKKRFDRLEENNPDLPMAPFLKDY